MEIKIYLHLCILTIIIQITCLNAQQDKCTEVFSPKIYSECGVYDNPATSTICCLIRGVYGGNNGTACIPVDILFANKSVTLTSNGVTGTMICGASVSSLNHIKLNYISMIIGLVVLLV